MTDPGQLSHESNGDWPKTLHVCPECSSTRIESWTSSWSCRACGAKFPRMKPVEVVPVQPAGPDTVERCICPDPLPCPTCDDVHRAVALAIAKTRGHEIPDQADSKAADAAVAAVGPVGRSEPGLPRTDNRSYDLRQRLNRAVRWLRDAEDIARTEMPAWPTADRIRSIYEQITEDVLNGTASIPPVLERLRAVEQQVGRSCEVTDALRELVRLKDGPRDDAYRAEKDAAWDRARAALGATERTDG